MRHASALALLGAGFAAGIAFVASCRDGTSGGALAAAVLDALGVDYANATSALAATNVQDAIDELDARVDALAPSGTVVVSLPTAYAASAGASLDYGTLFEIQGLFATEADLTQPSRVRLVYNAANGSAPTGNDVLRVRLLAVTRGGASNGLPPQPVIAEGTAVVPAVEATFHESFIDLAPVLPLPADLIAFDLRFDHLDADPADTFNGSTGDVKLVEIELARR
jgi:hypothetical protein